MEENKLQTENNGTQEIESAPAPQQEVKVEAEQSAAQPTPKPAPKQRKPQKKSSLTFGKVFLASLLAVVAGSVVSV